MAYRPPNVPPDPAQLPGFLRQELQQISKSIAAPVFVLALATSNKPPDRLRDGDTVLADGTNWNPGSGQGVYTYYGATWHKLG